MRQSGIFVDPQRDLYPNCVCDFRCEFPCWQRDGFDPNFDADDPSSCCCSRGEHHAEARAVEAHQEAKHERRA